MRRGEILGLEWRDVDLNRQVLVVMKSKNEEKRTVPSGTSMPQGSYQRERPLCVYNFLWDKD